MKQILLYLFISIISLIALPLSAQNPNDGSERHNRAIRDANAKVYPVPMQDVLKIDIHFPETQTVEIELYDLLGKKILELEPDPEQIRSNRYYMDVNQLSPGYYFLKVNINNGVRTMTYRVQKT